jgi:hypothetical protein
VGDVAGFTKETAYWIRSWWLSNIAASDAGKPPVKIGNSPTLFVVRSSFLLFPDFFVAHTLLFLYSFVLLISVKVESWNPPPSGSTRSVNVYTNLPKVKLLLNEKDVAGGATIDVPYFGQATFSAVEYAPGVLVAVGMDANGDVVATTGRSTPAPPAQLVLSLDAPSVATGTGSAVLLDGEDVALVRASLVDSKGDLATNSDLNITFTVNANGPGTVWATHSGDPANISPSLAAWTPAYHGEFSFIYRYILRESCSQFDSLPLTSLTISPGLARAFVRTTADYASPPALRRLMRAIDAEGTTHVADPDDRSDVAPTTLTVTATAPGLAPATLEIPLSTDAAKDSPFAAARASVRF